MGFAGSGDVGLMAGVLMAFIDDDQPFRFEIVGERDFDPGFDGHFGLRCDAKGASHKPVRKDFVNSCRALFVAP